MTFESTKCDMDFTFRMFMNARSYVARLVKGLSCGSMNYYHPIHCSGAKLLVASSSRMKSLFDCKIPALQWSVLLPFKLLQKMFRNCLSMRLESWISL